MEDYINPASTHKTFVSKVEVKENEQKTPKRITTIYQTTGIFQDISKEVKSDLGEDSAG